MTYFFKAALLLGIAEVAGVVANAHPSYCILLGLLAGGVLGIFFKERSME